MTTPFDPHGNITDSSQPIFVLVRNYIHSLRDLLEQDAEAARNYLPRLSDPNFYAVVLSQNMHDMMCQVVDDEHDSFYIRVEDRATTPTEPSEPLLMLVASCYTGNPLHQYVDTKQQDLSFPIGKLEQGSIRVPNGAPMPNLAQMPYIDIVQDSCSPFDYIPFQKLPTYIYSLQMKDAQAALESSEKLTCYLSNLSDEQQKRVGKALSCIFYQSSEHGITAEQMLDPAWRNWLVDTISSVWDKANDIYTAAWAAGNPVV
jgi:hypothetical protein